MAILRDDTNQFLYLRSLHLFGRSMERADTVLEQEDASLIHASIRWNGERWLLFDHSRNGTFFDRQPLARHGYVEIRAEKTIHFASDKGKCWTVVNLDPPHPLLLPLDSHRQAIILQGTHFLPQSDAQEVMVYLDDDGQWTWEDEVGRHLLRDGDVLHLTPYSWRYFNGMSTEDTAVLIADEDGELPSTLFHFEVSQNEEHVELRIKTNRGDKELGERSHHYSLLTLARQRLIDAERGYDRSSQGWLGTEQLADMLRLEPKHLNMQLHRARQQIIQAFPANPGLERFLERRRGELRFGDFRFQIVRGSQFEAKFNPFKPAF